MAWIVWSTDGPVPERAPTKVMALEDVRLEEHPTLPTSYLHFHVDWPAVTVIYHRAVAHN